GRDGLRHGGLKAPGAALRPAEDAAKICRHLRRPGEAARKRPEARPCYPGGAWRREAPPGLLHPRGLRQGRLPPALPGAEPGLAAALASLARLGYPGPAAMAPGALRGPAWRLRRRPFCCSRAGSTAPWLAPWPPRAGG